jgi:hypothetical protein
MEILDANIIDTKVRLSVLKFEAFLMRSELSGW